MPLSHAARESLLAFLELQPAEALRRLLLDAADADGAFANRLFAMKREAEAPDAAGVFIARAEAVAAKFEEGIAHRAERAGRYGFEWGVIEALCREADAASTALVDEAVASGEWVGALEAAALMTDRFEAAMAETDEPPSFAPHPLMHAADEIKARLGCGSPERRGELFAWLLKRAARDLTAPLFVGDDGEAESRLASAALLAAAAQTGEEAEAAIACLTKEPILPEVERPAAELVKALQARC